MVRKLPSCNTYVASCHAFSRSLSRRDGRRRDRSQLFLRLPRHGNDQRSITPSFDGMHDPLGFVAIVERPKPDTV